MKIIRKLTLSESIYRMSLVNFKRRVNYILPIDRELFKYGLKPNSFRARFHLSTFMVFAAFFAGYMYKVYLLGINENTLMARAPNRVFEIEEPRTLFVPKDYLHRIYLNHLYSHLVDVSMMTRQVTPEEEALIRMQQYQNFKKNRNPSMDFLSIGESILYPFPNIHEEIVKRNMEVLTSIEL